MQSRSSLFLLLVVGLTALSVVGYINKPYQYGLDVRGGVRLTYQMDLEALTTEQRQRLPEIQSQLLGILNARVSAALGVVEGNVARKGDDQFIVEIPGFTDIAAARQTLGSTAKIIGYHAKNVSTQRRERRYSRADEGSDEHGPFVTFAKRGSTEVLKPGDPEYKTMIDGWDVIIEGSDLADARPDVQIDGSTIPLFLFSSEGARKMESWSRRYQNQGENLAFVLDNRVLNIAHVKDNTILSDNAIIDGTFEPKYVQQLTQLLKAGSLPVPLVEIASHEVNPTIGSVALDKMVGAGIASFAAICTFLIAYYAFPGVIAAIAMLLYALLTLTVLKWSGATFSLAAIAAFILSVGMAVDANVLVFERLKEEVRNGKRLLAAVELGFKRALSAIIDSNACTILTSLVLWWLGTGPVKGFASTLIIGVALSFLTAIAITRSLLIVSMQFGFAANEKYFALNRSWFGEKFERDADKHTLNIVGNMKRYFLISAALVIPGMIFIGLGGIRPNVEFQGGYEGTYMIPAGNNLDSQGALSRLSTAGMEKANVKFGSVGNERIIYVTLPLEGTGEAMDDSAKGRIAEALGLSVEGAEFTKISPTIQKETVRNAILGVIISTILIVVYLAVRFGVALGGMKNGIKFGSAAVSALLHDVLFVLGLAAMVGYFAGWEISALFLTAMLTVIGFSVHDTIVIFDRIRENLRRLHTGDSFAHIVDLSITQSIARSINTGMNAIVPLIILIFFGTTTPELKFMCLTMLAGILIGTYSSIFNAAPILYLFDKATIKRKGEQAGLVAEAIREHKALRAATAVEGSQQVYREPAASSQYGQVKRRSSAVEKSKRSIDEDEE